MKIGSREKQILEAVGVGALLVGAVIIPGLPLALAPFLSGNKYSRQNVVKSIKRLEEKDIVYLSGEKIQLTPKGKKLLKIIQAEDITIKPTKWDNTWRIVAYDIPEKQKKERDYFRQKLIELGFVEIQKSRPGFDVHPSPEKACDRIFKVVVEICFWEMILTELADSLFFFPQAIAAPGADSRKDE